MSQRVDIVEDNFTIRGEVPKFFHPDPAQLKKTIIRIQPSFEMKKKYLNIYIFRLYINHIYMLRRSLNLLIIFYILYLYIRCYRSDPVKKVDGSDRILILNPGKNHACVQNDKKKVSFLRLY